MLSASLAPRQAAACSMILWDKALGTYVGRGEDWFEDAPTDLWVLPRGQERSGGAEVNPYEWTSKYGSLVVVMDGYVSMSGHTERGLAAQLLWLTGTGVAPRDPDVPGLSVTAWMQWYLDSFETVEEAVAATRALPFQLRRSMNETGTKSEFHIAVENADGDSAIFEIIDGEMKSTTTAAMW
jgi:choloylglycine hydrolase